jgi:hypothetical protein
VGVDVSVGSDVGVGVVAAGFVVGVVVGCAVGVVVRAGVGCGVGRRVGWDDGRLGAACTAGPLPVPLADTVPVVGTVRPSSYAVIQASTVLT